MVTVATLLHQIALLCEISGSHGCEQEDESIHGAISCNVVTFNALFYLHLHKH
jgi:hypothetical protein